MDFDEYDYLEKTVENPDADKSAANGKNGKLEVRALSDRIKVSRRRSDEDDHEYRSKRRTRFEEEQRLRSDRDRDRGRERGSRDRSDKGQDREQLRRGSYTYRDSKMVEDEKDRSGRDHPERHERDRERERERARGRGEKDGKDREKKYRHNDREHHSEREREIRDRDRECRLAQRSSSVSGRLPDREEGREHNHDRSMDIVLKDRERERELRDRDFKDRDPRRFKDKKEEAVEPEADPERDQRTVFAYQISLKADEKDVYEFFSRAGKVRDVQLIMDRNLRRSKGVGYIEFYDAMSVPMAIALSGQLLLGQPVMVKPSEAEKNIAQSNAVAVGVSGGLNGTYSGVARRLYVGNLHFNITENQLRQVFEPFGHVELVQLPTDPETGQCKGFGFVQFARLEDARAAQSINGQLDIAGRIIKVSAVTDQVGMQDSGGNTVDFDDDGGGLTLNARSRALLMQKLDRSGTATSTVGSVTTAPANPTVNLLGHTVPGVTSIITPLIPTPQLGQATVPGFASPTTVVEPIGPPSECLMLKNMFDPKNETEPDFDFDIREDVQDECSKFGVVKHIFVDKNSAGHVYVRFDTATSAIGAQRALHGRWFAGKMITASFMSAASYEANIPDGR